MRTDPAEVRAEALRFLYGRKALPHQISAVAAGLRRSGCPATDEDTQEALDYLTSAGFATRTPGPMGGGNRHATWKITHTGINAYEEAN